MSLIFTLIFSPLALKWDTEIEEYTGFLRRTK